MTTARLDLGTLVTRLRFELGHSSSPTTGLNMRDQLVYTINRSQEELLLHYDWPSLIVDRDIELVTGTRYYAYPADLPFENVLQVWLVWNSVYGKLNYGIGPAQFALWNSITGFRSWPVERWMHHSDDDTLEVWPVPSQAPVGGANYQSARIRLRGERFVPFMVADSDLCTMPPTAIVLFAAAERLTAEGKIPAATLKLAKAKEYLRRSKVKQSSQKTNPFVIGGGDTQGGNGRGRIGLDYIPYGYGSGPERS